MVWISQQSYQLARAVCQPAAVRITARAHPEPRLTRGWVSSWLTASTSRFTQKQGKKIWAFSSWKVMIRTFVWKGSLLAR